MAFEAAFINPFTIGAVEVFRSQCDMKVSIRSSQEMPVQEFAVGDIRGVIAVNAGAFRGMMFVEFPNPTFSKIVARMFEGTEHPPVSEIQDGVGEFANMILGYAKRELNALGYQIAMARPTVYSGESRQLETIKSRYRVSFDSEAGPFSIDLCEVA